MDGAIKAWRVPSLTQVEPYGRNKDYSCCIAQWENAHNKEPVWDIRVHPTENYFLSAGADKTIALWQLPHP